MSIDAEQPKPSGNNFIQTAKANKLVLGAISLLLVVLIIILVAVFAVPLFSNQLKCATDEFACKNGEKCIPHLLTCNGKLQDCSDGSDEEECFKCQNGVTKIGLISVLPFSNRCDGMEDCFDGSDEKNCKSHTCSGNRFKCQNGEKCLPHNQRCNGESDCIDDSDETNCTAPLCKGFFCASDKKCLKESLRCDANPDCSDGSDEKKCNETLCKEFLCKNNQCILSNLRCDGNQDCSDGNDEEDCKDYNCPLNHWKCENGEKCIANDLVCTGDVDCLDGSDEKDNCYQIPSLVIQNLEDDAIDVSITPIQLPKPGVVQGLPIIIANPELG